MVQTHKQALLQSLTNETDPALALHLAAVVVCIDDVVNVMLKHTLRPCICCFYLQATPCNVSYCNAKCSLF